MSLFIEKALPILGLSVFTDSRLADVKTSHLLILTDPGFGVALAGRNWT